MLKLLRQPDGGIIADKKKGDPIDGVIFENEPEADSAGFTPGGRPPAEYLNRLKEPSHDVLVWAAGVCEFYGSWGLYRNRPVFTLEITTGKDSHPALTRLTDHFGGSISNSRPWNVGESVAMRRRYRLYSLRACNFYNSIKKWLSPVRRECIEMAINYKVVMAKALANAKDVD